VARRFDAKPIPALPLGHGRLLAKMISNQLRCLIATCLLALLPASASADMVFWGCGYGEPQILRSGQIVCRQEVLQCTNMVLSCSRGPATLFKVNDFADHVAASDDGRYVVGLSNRGSENAYWIRDSSGKLIKRRTHSLGLLDNLFGIHYCHESVTNVREWFDPMHPDVRFQFKNGRLEQVVVRSCDGKDLHILK
jgi:hypothetical protein